MPSYTENYQAKVLGLVKESTRLAASIYQYQSQPRDYGTGEALYMREAHFIEAVGLNGSDMGELAAKLRVSNGAVSQLASRLEKKGFVERKSRQKDSRFIGCCLTEKGTELYLKHKALDEQQIPRFCEILSDFSEEELNCCHRFLTRLREAYDLEVQNERHTRQ